jgi:hypothetical protein
MLLFKYQSFCLPNNLVISIITFPDCSQNDPDPKRRTFLVFDGLIRRELGIIFCPHKPPRPTDKMNLIVRITLSARRMERDYHLLERFGNIGG